MQILKYPWHTAHDYELCKLPHEFSLVSDTHRRWATQHRPIPANVRFVTRSEANEADVAILHVDQWIFEELDKLFLFDRIRQAFDGPKVVINHGCNMVDGCDSQAMRELLAGLPVVCNSSTAKELWGLPDSRFIRHGMSPDEWGMTSHGRQNIVTTQPAGPLHGAYRNNDAVARFEQESGIGVDWIGRDYKFANFAQYRSFLQSSSVYFSPSYASPNPRARTEAMLCGLAVVTTGFHGEGEYIEHGVNGFVSNEMEELFDILRYLHRNPRIAERVGKRGRETAQQVFHIERFIGAWESLLREVA